MQTKTDLKQKFRQIRVSALADKHGCSSEYVRQILFHGADTNSVLSNKIMLDAIDMVKILERKTQVTL